MLHDILLLKRSVLNVNIGIQAAFRVDFGKDLIVFDF